MHLASHVCECVWGVIVCGVVFFFWDSMMRLGSVEIGIPNVRRLNNSVRLFDIKQKNAVLCATVTMHHIQPEETRAQHKKKPTTQTLLCVENINLWRK